MRISWGGTKLWSQILNNMNNVKVHRVKLEELFPLNDENGDARRDRFELVKKAFQISLEEEEQMNCAYNTCTNSKIDLSRVSFEHVNESEI